MRMLLLYGVLAWFVFLPVPIINGIFREAVLVPRLGYALAHALSTLILTAALLLCIVAFLNVAGDGESWPLLLLLGILWTAMTLAFEFGFGRLVAKKSWEDLLADYNVLAGRIWPLVPLTMLFAPVVVGA